MRFLANENTPGSAVRRLRERGDDVLYAKESMRGEPDHAILARAQSEPRIVLTQDKGFGELAFRARLPAESGVVLFRLSGKDPESDIQRIVQALGVPRSWAGHFAVLTETEVRLRPLPEPRYRS